MTMRTLFRLLRATVQEWSDDNVSSLAAALAYYTTFSLAPLFVVVISLAGLTVGQDAAQNEIMTQVEGFLGAEGRDFVEGMLRRASQGTSGAVGSFISAITLLIGALGVFGELQKSLNIVWDVPPPEQDNWLGTVKAYVIDRLLSFTMVLGVAFLLLVSLVLSASLSAAETLYGGFLPASLLQGVSALLSLSVITLLFAAMFKLLPDTEVAWTDVWVGAFATSLLFTSGKVLIGYYVGTSDVSSAFGAAGSVGLILIWVYYSAQIFFFGAEFTQVYASRYGSRLR